jgi:hypothetical protein
MGFDLNGINPKNIKIKEPKRPNDVYNLSDEEQEKYFKKRHKYLEQSGTYFRNNVWWWRPLAEYVIEHTKVINQDKITLEGWSSNSGFEVDDELATQIANQLDALVKSGHTKKYQLTYMLRFKIAEKFNKGVQKEIDKLNNLPRNKDKAPADYNKKDSAEWNRLYATQDRQASYPFSEKNVKEFSIFCRASGGFNIC